MTHLPKNVFNRISLIMALISFHEFYIFKNKEEMEKNLIWQLLDFKDYTYNQFSVPNILSTN